MVGFQPVPWKRTVILVLSWLLHSGLLAGTGTASSEDPRPTDSSSSEPRSRDVWEAYYIQGTKVGYVHTTKRPIKADGHELIEWKIFNKLELTRFGEKTTQVLELTSIENAQGELVQFRSNLSQGSAPNRTRGRVDGERLLITTTTQGKQQSSEIPWNSHNRGFFATEQLLEERRLQPGDKLEFRSLLPVFNRVAVVELEALQIEATDLRTGTHELLKIKSTVDLMGLVKIESYLWVDRTGQTLKTYVPAIQQIGYRTTRADALEQGVSAGFDLGQFSTVRLKRPLLQPHRTKRSVYRVRIQDGDPASVFVKGLSQNVTSLDEHTARVEVRQVRPQLPVSVAGVTTRQPTDDDLAANNLIQSDDERIVRMARRVADDATDAWVIAVELERFVRDEIRTKDFSQAFATAAEVAENLEGDCTEHSVLLAALCRARKIPARVAMGLVYYPKEQGFAYHMWSEVWIRDRWIPLDATLGLGGIGAAHLKLADSNLAGATAYSAFLPVFNVLGRLEIEVEHIE